jgi:hypothetical protein
MTDRYVGPGPGEFAILTSAQDAWNAYNFREIIERPLRERCKELAKAREAYVRKLLKRRLPRRLHWLIDRPRLLKRVLRLVPRWKPTTSYVTLSVDTTAEGATFMRDRWLQEQEARGRDTSGGHVFTYTDPSGLPAEVYGP